MVLAGGVGSRFWPASTPDRPKQILPLAGARPLIAETVDRIRPLIPLDRVRILTGEELVAPIRRVVPDLGAEQFMVEPVARGTAPVLVWAAHTLARSDPDAIMVSLHADHVIRPEDAFRDLVARAAADAAAHDRLLTIGIRPSRPDTGYGYIRRGAALGDGVIHEVAAFVEKPDAETARAYVGSGDYLWNTGIFIWRVQRLLAEVRDVTPELAELIPLLDDGDAAAFFDRAPKLSIDRGVLERSDAVGVIDATFDWDDVGTWDAVGRAREPDAGGNVVEGRAHLEDAADCVVWNETDEPVVVFGARDTVVVRRDGVTVVLPRDRAADLKDLLESLPAEIRDAPGGPDSG